MTARSGGTGVRWESRAFKVDDSFYFAAQIPDNTVGCSGSRCSHCGGVAAYCYQVCRECGLPFIGPFGFPQLPEWESLQPHMQRNKAAEVYRFERRQGRVGYANVRAIPLTPDEARWLTSLTREEREIFHQTHKVRVEDFLKRLSTLRS